MTKLEEVLVLVRSINEDEFQEQLTNGNSLDDVYKELLFLAEKIESKKKRTNIIIEHISNCYAGDFFNYLPISDAQDELDVFCMGFNTYIEELKAVMVSKNLLETINKKLVEEKERSEQLAMARDEFLSSMSHEIRTPLNGILGFTDLLLGNSSLDAESKKQLDYIKISGDILLVIINDILDLAKIESGQITLYEKPFDLSKLTQLIYDTFASKIEGKEIDFKISIDKKVPAILNGDSIRVSQILFNLISNAVKFTPVKGKIRLKIKFNGEEAGFQHIKVTVKDSGIGIPSDKIEAIFEPFIQVSNDTARKYDGTGLGLTIIKKIISIMDGDIQVKSKLNVGTKFIVNLPFVKGIPNGENIKSIKNNSKSVHAIDTGERIKVLLAEDNRINQILVQKVLSKFNFECVTVGNGSLAVEAVINGDFDVILMDIMMPIMNGYEATSIIRNLEDQTKKNIPIIALSAVVTGSVVEACSSTGIDRYLSKPFKSEELYNVIIELVHKGDDL
ncbi:ATP-binding protein [Flavobacterium granuli]|uniref:histidine kinase n=1 Tax=Flavobacterium granuli TaxID=280093 RepID=A0A1M5PR15_9FLAO|nr:ATP-binding protein [Flavobacterium granuli]PRZ26586.1 phospho-acceptor domain-containing protein [Flavobacterium granuli]SHH04198.1 His Kinase A (phospho-acceptor) domain-containing protein [Flavobacterium granuli]